MGLKSDLEEEVAKIYREAWNRRDGRKVPEDTDVASGNVGVDLQAAILYSDLSKSTKLVDNYEDAFAAENYKTFLRCASKIIRSEGGEIRSFDGDRVMGIFIGDTRFDAATRCGLKINWAVKNIVQAKMKAQYPNTNYVMKHVTGIDASKVMATKGGIRNSNDLLWIGKSANHAAKLCALDEFPTWISGTVYDELSEKTKLSEGKNMWQERKWTAQNNRRIFGSTYWWSLS